MSTRWSEEAALKFDIGAILRFWLDAGVEMQVERFCSKEKEEKLQISLNSGMLHINLHGRPDGRRPQGFPSYYDYYLQQTRAAAKQKREYGLSWEAELQLKQEFILYFVRNLALFKLAKFHLAAQDAKHNLLLLDFGLRGSTNPLLRQSFAKPMPECQMLYHQALAMISLHDDKVAEARCYLHKGLQHIHHTYYLLKQQGISSPRYTSYVLEKMIERLELQPPLKSSRWVERLTRQSLLKEKKQYHFLFD